MYKTPITFHKNLSLRSAFGGVNFALLLGILLFAYSQGAWHQYNTRSGQEAEEAAVLNLTEEAGAPSVTIDVSKDPLSGWNLRVETENFTFAPESIGLPHEPGEGHAHLYINDRKAGRIYGEWNHIGRLPPGIHSVRVELTTNQHRTYAVEGNIVADEAEIKVE